MEILSLAAIGGLLFNFWAVALFLLVSIFLINVDWKFWSGATYVVGLWAAYNVFNIAQYQLSWPVIIGGYFVIGLLWSFWRYKKFVKESVQSFNEIHKNSSVEKYQLSIFKESLSIGQNYSKYRSWYNLHCICCR